MRKTWNHTTPSHCQKVPTDNTSKYISKQVQHWQDAGIVIHPEAALEIAAWYQSPDGFGTDFERFASTGTITADLLDAIEDEWYLALSNKANDSKLELEALKAYVKAAKRERVYV